MNYTLRDLEKAVKIYEVLDKSLQRKVLSIIRKSPKKTIEEIGKDLFLDDYNVALFVFADILNTGLIVQNNGAKCYADRSYDIIKGWKRATSLMIDIENDYQFNDSYVDEKEIISTS